MEEKKEGEAMEDEEVEGRRWSDGGKRKKRRACTREINSSERVGNVQRKQWRQ